MEGYIKNVNSREPGGYLYGAGSSGDNIHRAHLPFTGFNIHSDGGELYDQNIAVKAEYGLSRYDHYPSDITTCQITDHWRLAGEYSDEIAALKAMIVSHPQYSNLLKAYIDCHKVGAPPEMVAHLLQVTKDSEILDRDPNRDNSNDPELDHFMKIYSDMLVKLKAKITKPLQESMEFIRRVETELNLLTNPHDDNLGGGCSSNDTSRAGEYEMIGGISEMDSRGVDTELKTYLLSKYRGYLSTLKQEFSKKKKKGKLPRESRQKLLTWWNLHYKWPYPSESEKVVLGDVTGLDMKQINNWFINQRKRHWKPSENIGFMAMDGLQHPRNSSLSINRHYSG